MVDPIWTVLRTSEGGQVETRLLSAKCLHDWLTAGGSGPARIRDMRVATYPEGEVPRDLRAQMVALHGRPRNHLTWPLGTIHRLTRSRSSSWMQLVASYRRS